MVPQCTITICTKSLFHKGCIQQGANLLKCELLTSKTVIWFTCFQMELELIHITIFVCKMCMFFSSKSWCFKNLIKVSKIWKKKKEDQILLCTFCPWHRWGFLFPGKCAFLSVSGIKNMFHGWILIQFLSLCFHFFLLIPAFGSCRWSVFLLCDSEF